MKPDVVGSYRPNIRTAMLQFITRFFTYLFLVTSVSAQFDVAFGGGDPATKARVVSEVKSVAAGKPFVVALELAHPEGWHSYYLNPGGIELSPRIEWKLPEGFKAGALQWPVPEVKKGFSGKSFIYNGTPVFLVEITPAGDLKAGETVTLSGLAEWQICKDSCLDEKLKFKLELPVAGEAEVDPEVAGVFEGARKRLAGEAKWEVAASSPGGDITLRVEAGGAALPEGLDFIPDQPFVEALSGGGAAVKDGDAWVLTLKRKTKDFIDRPIPQGKVVSGILTAKGEGFESVRVEEVAISRPPAAPVPFSKFLPILGGMLLGGLILNLMPCVFPVIGLKIMGFVQQAGEDRKKIVAHGVMFTVGVLASFGVLAGILFAVRLAAEKSGNAADALNWGYQLQEPWVVLGLMLLMFVLALNLFGVFEIGASATSVGGNLQNKQGFGGSFFSGVLATVVATPCSAPFLGVAIGAAIVLPAVQFFTAFAAMGIGLAGPYLMFSAFPGLLRFLPRPGAWMESFKQGMSFLLFATAGYLLWVYLGLVKLENGLGAVIGLSLVAAAAWVYGRWSLPYLRAGVRRVAMLLAVVLVAAGVLTARPKPKGLEWEVWSPVQVEALLDEDVPVFVDFTALWCLTCQTNKKFAYTPEVVELMKRKGVVALKADKTSKNPVIDEAISEYGRSAIPVNVLLVPGEDPVVTPEVLTPGYLLDLFGKLPDAEKE
jgi:thiol:disulfide interchange protein DsbD